MQKAIAVDTMSIPVMQLKHELALKAREEYLRKELPLKVRANTSRMNPGAKTWIPQINHRKSRNHYNRKETCQFPPLYNVEAKINHSYSAFYRPFTKRENGLWYANPYYMQHGPNGNYHHVYY